MSKSRDPKSFMRYPGSKDKLYRHIRDVLPEDASEPLWAFCGLPVYCEPFFGAGAIGWRLMRHFTPGRTQVIINDLDRGVAALWKAVRDTPDELIDMVRAYRPSAGDFYRFKERDGTPGIDTVVRGFEKLVLHQTGFSGLGYKAGGPLGGRSGKSRDGKGLYPIDCRWRPGRIAHGIGACHKLMRRLHPFDVRCEDFARVLGSLPAGAFAYLDPPYYVQGPSLYRHAFAKADHLRLAGLLSGAPFRWVLSYDDCPEIRDLYRWANVISFDMTATVSSGPRRKNSELLITPKEGQL